MLSKFSISDDEEAVSDFFSDVFTSTSVKLVISFADSKKQAKYNYKSFL